MVYIMEGGSKTHFVKNSMRIFMDIVLCTIELSLVPDKKDSQSLGNEHVGQKHFTSKEDLY